jgi:integrase
VPKKRAENTDGLDDAGGHPSTLRKQAKKKHRANGEGTIYKRADDIWIGRLMVGTRLDGKPDVRQVSAKSQAACRAKLDALKLQATNGNLSAAETTGLTVAAFLDRWLMTVEPNLRESTLRLYRGYVTKHFKPALGTKRLAKLTHDDVQAFLNAKRVEKRKSGKTEKTLAPRTLHHLYVVLGTALTWGIQQGYLTVSPMVRVAAPRVKAAEVVPLTAEQTMKLLEIAAAESDPLVALWTVAAYTGARKGELLGLTWGDVNLDAGTIHIRRTLKRASKRTPDYDDPKTVRSRRILDLDADAVDALRAHHDRQKFHRQELGDAYEDHGIVFASELGTPLDQANVSRRFKRALKRAGLPETTRMHDLRHGAATMMLEAGESVPTVSEYLGHASPAITMQVYAHAVPGSKRRAAERLGSVLRDARPAPERRDAGAAASG